MSRSQSGWSRAASSGCSRLSVLASPLGGTPQAAAFLLFDLPLGNAQNGGHRLPGGEEVAGRGAQPRAAGGVQQVEEGPLDLQGQVAVARAVPEGEGAAGEFPLELPFNLAAGLLHRGRSAAVQGEGPAHVQPLRPADEGVCLRPQCGAEDGRPSAAGQMGFQVLPGQEQAVFQPHAARFKGDFHRPPAPPGPDGPQQLPGAGLHLAPQGLVRLLRRTAHVPQDLVGVQLGDCDHNNSPRHGSAAPPPSKRGAVWLPL